ncbi:FAD-dependent oxidoreductase [Chryseolinea sp. H1M3-3]|uniref:NAD(P)/FAD-dependent oxidoreductase n=1 Tax=Chryseolinea sp. H1M3-3 TaxID=3034144 RepID=UPI0023EC7995|nr:FAD-dependent oxidoreductase [Chryseolinea sp. H1M3-3]
MKNIAIIGGGIIGLSTAYYLNKAGHKVTIFDQGNLKDNCSSGNAGMIVPSHIIPLAAPGMISKGIRWMFNSKSPFYVRPRLSGDLIRWGLKFYAHANHQHVEKSAPVLKEISAMSKSLYRDLAKESDFHFGYEERGLLMLYQTSETEKEEIQAANLANRNGVEARVLSLSEVQLLEPDVQVKARGGIYFPGDAHLIPQLLISNLIQHLQKRGVTIFSETRVDDFMVAGQRVASLQVQQERPAFDEYIIATGAWSGIFCSKLNLDLPMQSGKGYSFNLQDVKKNVRIPSLLLEGRVAVTPMGTSLRFGGTMEIGDTDRSVNMNRVKGIVQTIPKYYPEMSVNVPIPNQVWNGLRPCSPDGLPYIGRSSQYKNLIIATGHSMMGLSLGLATGKLVTELVNETETSMDISPFNPERFN